MVILSGCDGRLKTLFGDVRPGQILFLIWLRTQLESFSLALVTVVYVIAGLTMFLNPAIPGYPVYLTGGLVMVPRAETEFDSFVLGATFSSFVAFGVKLVAIAMQQKVIGERLGNHVTVRKFVQINSPTMKAIKLILQQKGLTVPKVLVLGVSWTVGTGHCWPV